MRSVGILALALAGLSAPAQAQDSAQVLKKVGAAVVRITLGSGPDATRSLGVVVERRSNKTVRILASRLMVDSAHPSGFHTLLGAKVRGAGRDRIAVAFSAGAPVGAKLVWVSGPAEDYAVLEAPDPGADCRPLALASKAPGLDWAEHTAVGYARGGKELKTWKVRAKQSGVGRATVFESNQWYFGDRGQVLLGTPLVNAKGELVGILDGRFLVSAFRGLREGLKIAEEGLDLDVQQFAKSNDQGATDALLALPKLLTFDVGAALKAGKFIAGEMELVERALKVAERFDRLKGVAKSVRKRLQAPKPWERRFLLEVRKIQREYQRITKDAKCTFSSAQRFESARLIYVDDYIRFRLKLPSASWRFQDLAPQANGTRKVQFAKSKRVAGAVFYLIAPQLSARQVLGHVLKQARFQAHAAPERDSWEGFPGYTVRFDTPKRPFEGEGRLSVLDLKGTKLLLLFLTPKGQFGKTRAEFAAIRKELVLLKGRYSVRIAQVQLDPEGYRAVTGRTRTPNLYLKVKRNGEDVWNNASKFAKHSWTPTWSGAGGRFSIGFRFGDTLQVSLWDRPNKSLGLGKDIPIHTWTNLEGRLGFLFLMPLETQRKTRVRFDSDYGFDYEGSFMQSVFKHGEAQQKKAKAAPPPPAHTCKVWADKKWQASGLNVTKGITYSITASGTVNIDTGKRRGVKIGPGGRKKNPFWRDYRVYKTVPHGCLMAMVGGKVYSIGSSALLQAPASGPLYFTLNKNYVKKCAHEAFTVKVAPQR